MELLEDYNFELQYYPRKANVVVDTLSKKSYAELASLMCREWHMLGYLSKFKLEAEEVTSGAFLFSMSTQPSIVWKVIEAQFRDDEVRFLLDNVFSETRLESWKVCWIKV